SAKVSVVIEEEESDGQTDEPGERAMRREDETAPARERNNATLWEHRFFGMVKRHRLSLALTLVTATAAVVIALTFNPFGGNRQAINSLAVMPFVNVDADANLEYLSDGITDSLINSLSQLPGLKVMSRNSVFRYKGQQTDVQEVGKQLGVRAVL